MMDGKIWISMCSAHITKDDGCGRCAAGYWADAQTISEAAARDRELRPQHYATGGAVSEPYPAEER